MNARATLEYDQRQHGARYPSRRPGFTFHYDGYYYANPWWLDPEIGIEVTEPTQLPPAHVQWCRDRYSSYEPATDTYVPRIGVRARCDSPYVTR